MRLRLAVSVLTLLMVLGLGFTFTATADTDTISGLTWLDLPETELGGATVPAILDLQRLDMSGGDIRLDGTLSYGATIVPVSLRGSLYLSDLGSAGDMVGTLTDETDNFTVVHFGIRTNPDCGALLTHDRARRGRVVMLYLLRNGTREFTVIEQPISKFGAIQIPDGQALGLDRASFGADFWVHRVLNPKRSDEVQIMAVQHSVIKEYSEYYEMGNGCWIRYKIKVGAYANGPSDIARGASDFNSKLEVLRKWTESNCALYVTENSPYVVAKYANPVNVKTRAYGDGSSKGDVLLKGRYNGYYKRKVSFWDNVSISLGFGVKVASVSWSHSLGSSKSVVKDEEYVFANWDPDHWTKIADYKFKDRYLPNKGMYFQAIVQNAWGCGSRSTRKFTTRWVAPIYADYDDMSTTLYYKTTFYLYNTLSYYSG